MDPADCPECRAYEAAVMDRAPGAADPEPPCGHYAMSPAFQQWVVDRMQREVMDQVQEAGLDRMGIVKAPADEDGAGTA